MYDRKDIILTVDYHAENTEVRWLDCHSGEERRLNIPTTRGGILRLVEKGIAEASRAHALVCGRPSVGFEDVKTVVAPVLNHRLILNYQARFDRMTPSKLVTELLGQLDEAGLKLPKDVELARK